MILPLHPDRYPTILTDEDTMIPILEHQEAI
jgi:hypothetical protein